MKITEWIKRFQEVLQLEGDLEVVVLETEETLNPRTIDVCEVPELGIVLGIIPGDVIEGASLSLV